LRGVVTRPAELLARIPVTVGGQDREAEPAADVVAVARIPGSRGFEVGARAPQRVVQGGAAVALGRVQELEPLRAVVALELAFLDAGGNRVGGGRARRTGVVARHPAGAVPDRVVADAVVVAKLAERLAGRVLGQLHARAVVGVPGREVGRFLCRGTPGRGFLRRAGGDGVDVLVVDVVVAAAGVRVVDADPPGTGGRVVDGDLFVVVAAGAAGVVVGRGRLGPEAHVEVGVAALAVLRGHHQAGGTRRHVDRAVPPFELVDVAVVPALPFLRAGLDHHEVAAGAGDPVLVVIVLVVQVLGSGLRHEVHLGLVAQVGRGATGEVVAAVGGLVALAPGVARVVRLLPGLVVGV